VVAVRFISMNHQGPKKNRDYQERSKLTFHTDSYARGYNPVRQDGDFTISGPVTISVLQATSSR